MRSRKRRAPARPPLSTTDDHAAEAVHLALGERVLRMRWRGPGRSRARPSDASPASCGDRQRVRAVRAPCAAPASSGRAAPGSCRTGPAIAPTAFCRKASCSAQLGVVADHDDAADHVGVAVQVLGRRVHDDVEAELERPLQTSGLAKVLSATAMMPRLRGERGDRRRGRPACSSGLVGVSTQISLRVRAGSPPRRASRSVRSTKLKSQPGRCAGARARTAGSVPP